MPFLVGAMPVAGAGVGAAAVAACAQAVDPAISAPKITTSNSFFTTNSLVFNILSLERAPDRKSERGCALEERRRLSELRERIRKSRGIGEITPVRDDRRLQVRLYTQR